MQEDLASPIRAFLRDRCDIGDDKKVDKAKLYHAWVSYCRDNGHDRVSVASVFSRDLYGVKRGIKSVRDEKDGKHYYSGIDLISEFKAEPKPL